MILRCRLPLPLVAKEEEEAIFAIHKLPQRDRTADRASELMALQDRPRIALRVVKKIAGVERVIPEISCESAREDIRSRLRDCIDKHAGGAPLAGVKPV